MPFPPSGFFGEDPSTVPKLFDREDPKGTFGLYISEHKIWFHRRYLKNPFKSQPRPHKKIDFDIQGWPVIHDPTNPRNTLTMESMRGFSYSLIARVR